MPCWPSFPSYYDCIHAILLQETLGFLQLMAAAAFLSSILMRRPGQVSAGTCDVCEVLSTQDAERTVNGSAATGSCCAMLAFAFQATLNALMQYC